MVYSQEAAILGSFQEDSSVTLGKSLLLWGHQLTHQCELDFQCSLCSQILQLVILHNKSTKKLPDSNDLKCDKTRQRSRLPQAESYIVPFWLHVCA